MRNLAARNDGRRGFKCAKTLLFLGLFTIAKSFFNNTIIPVRTTGTTDSLEPGISDKFKRPTFHVPNLIPIWANKFLKAQFKRRTFRVQNLTNLSIIQCLNQ